MLSAGTIFRFACAAAVMLPLAGCKPTPVTDAAQIDPTHERLLKIGLAYREFNDRNGRPPAKQEDLQKSLPDESAWTSARDQLPLVVIWNVDLSKSPPATVMAYEQTGLDGKRLVRTAVGSTEEMSAADFAKATFPPGHTPPP